MENATLTEYLVSENQSLLSQARRVVSRLPAPVYASEIAEAGGQRIGAQIRHVLEFYSVFLNGFEQGVLDYDARPREGELETDPAAALRRIEEMVRRFDRVRGLPAGLELQVRAEDADPQMSDCWLPSTAGRELQFLRSHAIHHFALIALLLRAIGLPVEPDFGVAPSTLRYQAEAA